MPEVESVPQLAWSVADAARRLGLGRTTVWNLVRAGELRSFTVERRRLIPEAELVRFVEERFQ